MGLDGQTTQLLTFRLSYHLADLLSDLGSHSLTLQAQLWIGIFLDTGKRLKVQDPFKIDIGDLHEDAVQKAVEDAFSSDFVFRSPRREGGKEVTDVLVLYDDVGLVIQAKAKAIDPNGNQDQKSIQWARKNLKKAFRQTKGAIRAIREGRMAFVENRRRGRIPFQQSEFPYVYGLIVLHHRAEPYLPQDLVPEIKDCGFPLHVLSFSDFANLAYYLDTPFDLVNYFEHRSGVLIPMLNPRVHEEINASFAKVPPLT